MTHRVESGEGLWVPAGGVVEVAPSPGAVLLPTPALPGGPSGPTRVRVTPAQIPGLLHEFSCSLGHLAGAQEAAIEVRTVGATRLTAPPAPQSDDLHDLAELLTDDPDLNVADAIDAAVAGWSVRTVQRRFAAETGLTLSAWVRRARISAAADLIARGRSIEWVAHRVGYRSVAGFTRGFAEVAGLTPGQWRRAVHTPTDGTAELRVPGSWERRTHRTWSRVNGAHIAVWAADGPVQITTGTRAVTLQPGEAVILPAGVPNDILIPPGSLLLPLGFRSGESGAIGAPLQPAQLGRWGCTAALRAVESMLAAYTRVGTHLVDPARGFRAVLTGSQQSPVNDEDAILAALSSLVARDSTSSGTDLAAQLGVSERELRRIVLERAGDSFPAWLRRSRMTRARNRLGAGESSSEISRTLGYAHLPAFSRAFRAVHGAGPSTVGITDLRRRHAAWGREPLRSAASAA
ncbi:helix-turn-helix domain-containing protein [Leucobacter sp. 7(1)]|uniref:helix-turn-helix domain-containing protein n=1 Tax=Leucobacter sp. 7(1) TaxID=1255613 RepID=UPI0015962A2C|nr:helix-turn-helix domain-containing protein [Leucobacter sp. 7(1)]